MKYVPHRPKDKARVRARETLSKQIYLHPPTPIVSFKKSSDNTPSGRYGDVVQLLATVPSAPEDRKDVANQDLMVRMIRRCVGLINKQKRHGPRSRWQDFASSNLLPRL